MTTEKIYDFFADEGEEKTIKLDIYRDRLCMQADFSVKSGCVTVSGSLSDDNGHELGFLDLRTGEVKTTAKEGIYSLLGAEALQSVTFKAQAPSCVSAKFIW